MTNEQKIIRLEMIVENLQQELYLERCANIATHEYMNVVKEFMIAFSPKSADVYFLNSNPTTYFNEAERYAQCFLAREKEFYEKKSKSKSNI